MSEFPYNEYEELVKELTPEQERVLDEAVAYIGCDFLERYYDELRSRFEPLVHATDRLPETTLITALTMRLNRLAQITRIVCKQGFKPEAQILFRAALESLVNLVYIMEVGPKLGDKSSAELAQQFWAYGDVAYEKLIRTRDKESRQAFAKHHGMTDAQYDVFYQEKKKLRDAAIKAGCQKGSWHNLDLNSMANLVKEHSKHYQAVWADLLFSSQVGENSAVHGDALFLRSYYNETSAKPLELVQSDAEVYANAVSTMARDAWEIMAEYFGQDHLDWFNAFQKAKLSELMKERADLVAAWEAKQP